MHEIIFQKNMQKKSKNAKKDAKISMWGIGPF